MFGRHIFTHRYKNLTCKNSVKKMLDKKMLDKKEKRYILNTYLGGPSDIYITYTKGEGVPNSK